MKTTECEAKKFSIDNLNEKFHKLVIEKTLIKNVLHKTREELDVVRDNNEYLQNYIYALEQKN